MAKRTKIEAAALRELRRLITMENARFSFSEEQVEAIARRGYYQDHTPEIKEVTRLHRETWILPILDALIDGDNHELRLLSSVWPRR